MPILGLSEASSLGGDSASPAGDAAGGLAGAGRKGLAGAITPADLVLACAALEGAEPVSAPRSAVTALCSIKFCCQL